MPFSHQFFYITPIVNIPSILEKGLLSNHLVKDIEHKSFAMTMVQERRDSKNIPGGLGLHQYVNIYFDARNPTMYKIHEKAERLTVLVISESILALPDVVISDMNAASPVARFFPADRLNELNFERIYAEDWRHLGDIDDYNDHRRQKCAEVLVPNSLGVEYILEARVVSLEAKELLKTMGFPEDKISLDAHIFFS